MPKKKPLNTSIEENQFLGTEKFYRLIFEQSPLGIIQLDVEFRIVAVNAAFVLFIGYSEDELKLMSILDITHPDDLEITFEMLRRFLKEGKLLERFKKRYVHKSGKTVWAAVSSRAVHYEEKGEDFLFSIIEDITEITRAHDQLVLSEKKYFVTFEKLY